MKKPPKNLVVSFFCCIFVIETIKQNNMKIFDFFVRIYLGITMLICLVISTLILIPFMLVTFINEAITNFFEKDAKIFVQ